MKKLLYIVRFLCFACVMLILFALAPAMAQNVVHQGETTPLSVDEVASYSYSWELYSDGTVNLATVPGNCPATSADFVGGNIGSVVNVKWLKPGIYYFKLTIWDATGCGKNIQIGEMEVLESKPTAVITPLDPLGICAGETYPLEVVFTGTGPWNLKYTDGTSTYTVSNIPESTYLLVVSPKVSTEYWVTEVKDKYGTNTEPSEKVLLHIEPLPATSQISPISIPEKICLGSTHRYSVTGDSASTYTWKLDGVDQGSTTDFIDITWTAAGNYSLEVQEHGIRCDGEVKTASISVYDQPTAFAGKPVNSCSGETVKLAEATAHNFSALHWSSAGDGTFTDANSLQPNYTAGPNDISAGGVELTLTAEGLGNASGCIPAVSKLQVNILNLEAIVAATNVTCYGAKDGTLTIVDPKGGSGNYQFTIDGTSWVASLVYDNLGPGNYTVRMRDLSMPICVAILGNITITEPDPLAASTRHSDATCLGNDGTITIINPSGGSGSYEYSIGGIWSNGFFAGLAPGTYAVQMRDANVPECRTGIGSVVISKPTPIAAKVTLTNVSCFGGTDGQISITEAINGSGIYEFSIDGTNWILQSSLPFSNLTAGTYLVRMRDFNAPECAIVLTTGKLTEPTQLTANHLSTNVSCFGGSDGTITVTNPNGGSGKFEFSVDGASWQTGTSFAGLFAGTYMLQMRDFSSPLCVRLISEVTVTEPLQLQATVTSTDITCYGSRDGIISVTNPKNGFPPYQFTVDGTSWSGSGSFTGLGPKSYPVRMRDSKGCMQELGTVAIVEPEPLSATVNSTNVTCLGNDGTIIVTNTESGSGFYEYSIDDIQWTDNDSFTGLGAKTYSVQIRDAKRITCKRTIASVFITDPEPLSAMAVISNVTCFGGNDGLISLSNQKGGSGIYEFSLDGATWQNSAVIGNLSQGTYTVQMRDAMAENCMITIGQFKVTQPEVLGATVVPTDVTCFEGNNGYLTLTDQAGGSGSYEYSVNGVDWVANKIENLKIGTYTVQMRDAAAHDCRITLPAVEIKQPDKIIAQVEPTNVTCYGGSDGTITVSKPLNGTEPYQFSLDGGITWQNSGIFTGLPAKIYDLMVIQDVNACSAKLQKVEITQPDPLEVTVKKSNETNPGANDGTITISGQTGGSGDYEYSTGENIWQASSGFTSMPPGNYVVQIRDAKAIDCIINRPVVILPAGSIQATFTSTDITCYNGHDGSIAFSDPQGATNYEYSIDDGVNWQTSEYFQGLTARNYTLMIRDADIPANISALGDLELSQPALLNATITVGNESFTGANDGTITITSPKGGSGEYQYSLDNINWFTTNIFTGLSSGIYNIWIIDKNAPDCKLSKQKIIQPAGSLSADVVAVNISCNGSKNGTIIISNASGATDYDFSIDAGATWQATGNFAGLSSGTYNPMVRDRLIPANQFALGEIFISEPGPLQIFLSYVSPLCAGTSGTVSVSAKGGTGIITGTGKFDVAAGERRVYTITDENGCTNAKTFTMPAPAKIEATATVVAPKCSDENGTVTVSATGGTGIYVGVETFTVQPGKAYSFKVTDSNGCVSNLISGVMSAAPAKLEATAVTTDPLCFGLTGSATVTAKGGSGNYSYQWNDPAKQTTSTATGLAPGLYTVSVTDANGCGPVSVLTLVKEPQAIIANAKVTIQPSCFAPEGTIEISEPLGEAYEYSADGIRYQSSPLLAGLSPGNYSVKVREVATGCESLPIALTVDPIPVVHEIFDVRVSLQPNCTQPTGTIGVLSPIGTDYEYSLDEITYQDSPDFANLASGDYFVTLRVKSSGCELSSASLIINPIPADPEAPTASVVAQPDCFTATGTIRVTAPLGSAYEYAIDGTNYQANPDFANAAPGLYSVQVKVMATGCVSDGTILTVKLAPSIPDVPVSKGDISLCADNPLQTINANTAIIQVAGISLSWYDSPVGGNKVVSPVLNTFGSVILYAEASNGTCISSSRTPVTLSIAPIPSAPAAVVTVNPSCNFPNGTAVVTSPEEGKGYEYSMDGGTYQISATFASLKWGDHSVRVRLTSSGCESATATLVKVPAIPPAPVLVVTSTENSICYEGNGSISFAVTNAKDGIYTIKYDGGELNNVSLTGGLAKVIVPAGTYSHLTIEANGCTSGEIISVTVTAPGRIDITESVTEIDLKAQSKGAIDLHVNGGTGPYTYKWSNGKTTEDIQNLNDGSYSVTVTDANGCAQTKLITIPLPNFPPVAISDEYTVGCFEISGSLIANDYDPEGDPFFLDQAPVEHPKHGILTFNADGSFSFHADTQFTGTDFFSYAIYDSKHYSGDTAMVVLNITSDMDCDVVPDDIDPDADGDGILNVDEVTAEMDWKTIDSDGDGHPNYLDIDADGDGIVDNIETQSTSGYISPSGIDENHNGLDAAYDLAEGGTRLVVFDNDGDGIPDFLDYDSDNDGVPDYIEGNDLTGDGKADRIAIGKDSDYDGLDDVYDTVNRFSTSGNAVGTNAPIQDFDGDGTPDWRDDNDDNDKYLTRYEDLNADSDFSNDDTDGDGHPEYLDFGRVCDMFIPNIFSPNNDNIHEYFQIYCIDHYPNAKIYVFDQMGNKIFEKDHYGNLEFWGAANRAWWNGRCQLNGKVSNELVPVGTYYYVLNLGNGEVKKSYVFVSY